MKEENGGKVLIGFSLIGTVIVSIAGWFKFVPGIAIGDSLFVIGLVMALASFMGSKDKD